ncbi:hypothetical protein D9M69_596350 [compost metagenome]
MAALTTGTSAFESAGAMTSALIFCAIICSTILIWAAVSVSSLMPLATSVYCAAWAFWCALAPSSMVRKNSLASDFMTSATFGLSCAKAGVPAMAPSKVNAAALCRVRRVNFMVDVS